MLEGNWFLIGSLILISWTRVWYTVTWVWRTVWAGFVSITDGSSICTKLTVHWKSFTHLAGLKVVIDAQEQYLATLLDHSYIIRLHTSWSKRHISEGIHEGGILHAICYYSNLDYINVKERRAVIKLMALANVILPSVLHISQQWSIAQIVKSTALFHVINRHFVDRTLLETLHQ